MFHEELGIKIVEVDTKIKYREAVRAVIIEGEKILLVHSNLGDYKFPGGGVKQDESHLEALKREITEETGYLDAVIGEKIGTVIQRQVDEYEPNVIFQMNSHYYLCSLPGEKGTQNLDEYELEQEYTPKWVSIDEAIEQNQKMMEQFEENNWIPRENYVLRKLKDEIAIVNFVEK